MKQVLFLGAFASIALIGIYTLITFYDDNMRVGRMRETPAVRPHEQALLIMEQGTIPINNSEVLLRESMKHDSPQLSIRQTKTQLELGKKEFHVFCSPCHGKNLDGLGTVGQSFNPLPTKLTSQKVTRMTNKELFAAISYGNKRLPALASSMTEESRWAVIQYLRFRQNNP